MTTVAPNNHHIKQLCLKTLYVLTTLVSLILILDIAIFDIPDIANNKPVPDNHIQFWICIYFLVDFFVVLILTNNKVRYLKRYGFLVLISIPYINVFNYLDLTISSHSFYLLKFLPIIRGVVAIALLAHLLISNKITGLFITYLVLFFSIAYIQTLIFFLFEVSVNPLVKSYSDTLWWASMTATTLGSNIIPITTAGKICTGILAISGITIFPIFTVYITSLVQNLNNKHK